MNMIRPVSDLRNNFADISRTVHETAQPVFLTKNGYGDMVIMSMALFEERLAQLEMRDKILAGKAQADSGELLDGPDTMSTIGKRYGISI